MDAIQRIVVDSLNSHPEFLNDKNALRGALLDILPKDKLQANVLLFAYEQDVVNRLKGEGIDQVKASVISGLQNNYGITKENAAWGVETWCYVLGIEQTNNSFQENEYDDNSYERRVKKALQAVQSRRNWRQNQLTIYNDGQLISEPENYEKIFLQCDINTIDLSRCKNLKHLFIWSGSHGDLFGIPVTKELSISIFYDWQYLKQFSFGEAEDLSLSIYTTDDVVALCLEKTKKLSLSFKNKNDTALPVALNLTGCNKLEELTLSHVKLKDYENIGELESLRSISIKDSEIPSLVWLQNWPQIETVSLLDCNISDIKGIEDLRNLCTLNLNNNRISNLSPALELLKLKKLYVQGNPVDGRQIEALRNNGVSVIAIDEDRDPERAANEEERFLESAIDIQLQEDDKPLSEFPEFQQKTIKKSRELPFDKRLESMIQRRFQIEFSNMTPWKSWEDRNNWEARDKYIKKKQELYPFLKVPVQMLNAMDLEKQKFCESDSKNRLVYIWDGNIIAIDVEMTPGRGALAIKGQESYFCSKIANLVKKNWPRDRQDTIENNFFEITITDKYWRVDAEDLIYPVIITALALYEGICAGKTVVIGNFKIDGTLKRESSSMRNIRIAEKECAKNAFIYGSARSYDRKELSRYHLNYCYVKDYRDVLNELKAVSKDKFEQMSLMDFM
ncbi:hypothetical protein [Butyrivibrio sp. FCS006]|uniref:hypothetical protein n=1 Tax=Butyrivibrio sp. FCS006 TaxID=1280684 RepID=UPI000414A725|nr:hypothetical protein [Butyrivibrio sp. FCS006]